MNNNSFLHHQWVESPPPCTQSQTGSRESKGRKSQTEEPKVYTEVQKKSPKSTGLLKVMIPVEDRHIFTMSLSAEGSVSCLHLKWMKP